jgi:hypothetical protein
MLEVRHRVVPGGRRIVSGESGVLRAVARDETSHRELLRVELSKVTPLQTAPPERERERGRRQALGR